MAIRCTFPGYLREIQCHNTYCSHWMWCKFCLTRLWENKYEASISIVKKRKTFFISKITFYVPELAVYLHDLFCILNFGISADPQSRKKKSVHIPLYSNAYGQNSNDVQGLTSPCAENLLAHGRWLSDLIIGLWNRFNPVDGIRTELLAIFQELCDEWVCRYIARDSKSKVRAK